MGTHVLMKSGPGYRGRSAFGTTHVGCLDAVPQVADGWGAASSHLPERHTQSWTPAGSAVTNKVCTGHHLHQALCWVPESSQLCVNSSGAWTAELD